jgi:hypothetical protein
MDRDVIIACDDIINLCADATEGCGIAYSDDIIILCDT